jgi:hypothetical protein
MSSIPNQRQAVSTDPVETWDGLHIAGFRCDEAKKGSGAKRSSLVLVRSEVENGGRARDGSVAALRDRRDVRHDPLPTARFQRRTAKEQWSDDGGQ